MLFPILKFLKSNILNIKLKIKELKVWKMVKIQVKFVNLFLNWRFTQTKNVLLPINININSRKKYFCIFRLFKFYQVAC